MSKEVIEIEAGKTVVEAWGEAWGKGSRREALLAQARYNRATIERIKSEPWRRGAGLKEAVDYLESLAKHHEELAQTSF